MPKRPNWANLNPKRRQTSGKRAVFSDAELVSGFLFASFKMYLPWKSKWLEGRFRTGQPRTVGGTTFPDA